MTFRLCVLSLLVFVVSPIAAQDFLSYRHQLLRQADATQDKAVISNLAEQASVKSQQYRQEGNPEAEQLAVDAHVLFIRADESKRASLEMMEMFDWSSSTLWKSYACIRVADLADRKDYAERLSWYLKAVSTIDAAGHDWVYEHKEDTALRLAILGAARASDKVGDCKSALQLLTRLSEDARLERSIDELTSDALERAMIEWKCGEAEVADTVFTDAMSANPTYGLLDGSRIAQYLNYARRGNRSAQIPPDRQGILTDIWNNGALREHPSFVAVINARAASNWQNEAVFSTWTTDLLGMIDAWRTTIFLPSQPDESTNGILASSLIMLCNEAYRTKNCTLVHSLSARFLDWYPQHQLAASVQQQQNACAGATP